MRVVSSERALKQLKSCANTSTVKAAVRALSRLCVPSISPPGKYMSIVSSVTAAMITPISITPIHMRASITRSVEPARLARHDVVGLRIDAHRQCRSGVGDEIDPQDLRRKQRQHDAFTACR